MVFIAHLYLWYNNYMEREIDRASWNLEPQVPLKKGLVHCILAACCRKRWASFVDENSSILPTAKRVRYVITVFSFVRE